MKILKPMEAIASVENNPTEIVMEQSPLVAAVDGEK